MTLLDGKAAQAELLNEIRETVSKIKASGKRAPHLAAVLVGNDPASETYVNAKIKACEKVGFDSSLVKLPEETTQETLLEKIAALNADDSLDGFIVQVPLPKHIDEQLVIERIKVAKDVDGFHPENMGRMLLELPALVPATPAGIMELLERNKVALSGAHAVVLGRSHTVGTPISVLLSRKNANATVTLCHSRTKNLAEITRQADILIVALGRVGFVSKDMVKPGAVVVDVGIHRVEDASKKRGYRLAGDVIFDEVAPLCDMITPVPGGVGPMTIAALLKNTLLTYEAQM